MKKMYVVVSADNVSMDVDTTDIYTTLKAARKALNAKYKYIVSSFSRREIEEKNKTSNGFSVLVVGDDLFYANIKEVKFAEATE